MTYPGEANGEERRHMQLPSAYQRAGDAALLARLADPDAGTGSADRVLLDGRRPAYLVAHGRANLFAVRRTMGPGPLGRGHFLTTLGQGAVVPSSTVLGAWQLVLVPLAGAWLRPLSSGRLLGIGYGSACGAEPPDVLMPAPRAVSVLVTAFARGLDVTLLALSDALRRGLAPPHAKAVAVGQIVSLDACAAVTGDGGVGWLRVAGGHARRNGEDATVFGGAEPALLSGRDWIVVDGPATVEATGTADLLATGHLPAALDQHLVLTLRAIDSRTATP